MKFAKHLAHLNDNPLCSVGIGTDVSRCPACGGAVSYDMTGEAFCRCRMTSQSATDDSPCLIHWPSIIWPVVGIIIITVFLLF